MFQQLFSSESARRRHGDAPFADERERYLQHCGCARQCLIQKFSYDCRHRGAR
jgi:hypothetical protein